MDDLAIYLYLNDDTPPEEQKEAELWIRNNPEQYEKIRIIWENSQIKNKPEPDIQLAWQKISAKRNKSKRIIFKSGIRNLKRIAAILIMGVTISMAGDLIIKLQRKSQIIEYSAFVNSEEVRLPDGSSVWLKKGSTIRYSKKFNEDIREVRMQGEAFFAVSHDKARPFIVYAGNTETNGLGTSFNVTATDTSEKITVNVVTGKVAFSHDKEHVILTKDEQGVFSVSGNKLTKKCIDNVNFLSWKTGKIEFKNTSLPDVCEVLGNHFDTNIFVDDPILYNKQLTARFQGKSIDEILQVIELTLDVKFKKNKNRIGVMPK